MAQKFEYQVSWKREGCRRLTKVYQSWGSAHRNAQGIMAPGAVRASNPLRLGGNLPAMAEPPLILARSVGPWGGPLGPTDRPAELTEGDNPWRAGCPGITHPWN